MGFVPDSPLQRTRRSRVVAAAVLLVAAAAGVVVYRATRPDPLLLDPAIAARTVAGATVLMEVEEFRGAVAGVGIGGKLSVLPGGCLGLARQGDIGPTLLVFPPGTKVTSSKRELAVRVPGLADPRFPTITLHPGDVIVGGTRFDGVGVPVEEYTGLAERTPRACRGYRAMNVDAGVTLDPRY